MEAESKKALALELALDSQSETLVVKADTGLTDIIVGRLREALSQFNTVLSVALDTPSPRVVINWIQYQMGRKETMSVWENSGLGAQVLADIRDLEENAKQVAGYVYGDPPTADQVREVYIRLIQRYLGYLKRCYVAKGGQK